MPNWCNNSVQLTFPNEESANKFQQCIERVESDKEYLDDHGNQLTILGHFVPEPNYDDEGAWYWWRVNNWGTKWDVSLYNHDWIDDTTVVIGFDTAWSPPIQTFEAMEEQDIIVEATYYEPGMCFVGRFGSGGDREHYDYAEIEDPQELRDYIGEDLDDEWNISEWMREWQEEEAQFESDSGVENFG